MDKQLSPPLRIQPVASTPVKSSSAIVELNAFLDDYNARHERSDNATIRVQIQRLIESLEYDEEEEGIQKRRGKEQAV